LIDQNVGQTCNVDNDGKRERQKHRLKSLRKEQ
jgi:hypothetical protein